VTARVQTYSPASSFVNVKEKAEADTLLGTHVTARGRYSFLIQEERIGNLNHGHYAARIVRVIYLPRFGSNVDLELPPIGDVFGHVQGDAASKAAIAVKRWLNELDGAAGVE